MCVANQLNRKARLYWDESLPLRTQARLAKDPYIKACTGKRPVAFLLAV